MTHNNTNSLLSFSGSRGYENRMVLVTSLVISTLAFDRLSTGFIGPYLVQAFGLSNTEVGALYSLQALAVAVSGYWLGRLSDARGWRKQLLIPSLLAAAFCSVSVLLAQTYLALLLVRIVIGVAFASITPVTQSILSEQSSPRRFGLNIGVQTLLMFLVAQMLGPVIHTRLADHWGWHASYLASSIPFVLLAIGVAFMVRGSVVQGSVVKSRVVKASAATEPTTVAEGVGDDRGDQGEQVADGRISQYSPRNVWICIGISSLFMIWLVTHSTFLSLYFVQERHFSPTEVGSILSVLGLAGCVGGLGLPMLSDRIGRRNTLILAMGLSTIVPLTALFYSGSGWLLSLALFTGWLSVGVLPIYSVIIPGESVPGHRVAGTIALILGAGELVGGVCGPLLAGKLGDHFGLTAPFVMSLGTSLVCLVLAYALVPTRETAALRDDVAPSPMEGKPL